MAVRYNQRWEEMEKSGTPLKRVFESYALYNRSEGKASATISWYDDKLREFLRWLDGQGDSTDLAEFTIDRVREFVLHLQGREDKYERNPFVPTRHEKLSSHTIQGHVRVLKAFASWLYREGYTDDNLLQWCRLPKARRIEWGWLTQEGGERPRRGFDRKTGMGARDFAIVLTFLDSGLRCGDLCNLALDGADLDTGQLKVIGKGNKERTVPVGVRAVRALRRYRDHFRPPIEAPNFFMTVEGKPLTVASVRLMIRRAKQRANIPRLHAHLLRHPFAIHYLMAGGDVFSLQRTLGHSSLEVTRMYVNMVASQVKEKHRLFSPMDNMPLRGERSGKKPVREGSKLWRVK